MNKKNIIWLASYPKSGNTWFRSFLSALFNESEIDINDLTEGKIFSRRSTFEEVLDIDSTLLSDDEIKAMHASVYQYIANKSEKPLFFKIHDAYIFDKYQKPIVPVENTNSVIYFVRNPLDVVISFANHNNDTIDQTTIALNDENYFLSHEKGKQIKQPLLTWSSHYLSWKNQQNIPINVVRYEDMLSDTFNVFKGILEKIGLDYSDESIQRAIDATSFEKLKKQEEEKGFVEKNPNSPRFFNNGTSGTWKGKLTEVQINKIIENHGEVMKELGYL